MKNAWETDPAIIHLGTSYLLSSPDHLLIATYHFEGEREKKRRNPPERSLFRPWRALLSFWRAILSDDARKPMILTSGGTSGGHHRLLTSSLQNKIPPSVPAVMCESPFKCGNVEDNSWWEVRRRMIDCKLDCKCKFSSFATFCLKPWSLCKAACTHIKISEISPSFPLQCRFGSKITSTS